MKRTFEIEFPDDCGPLWMNKDNLMMCLITKEHTSNIKLSIRDITRDEHDKRWVVYSPESSPQLSKIL